MTAFRVIYEFFKLQKGYSIQKIAQKLDVSIDTVKNWMKNGYTPTNTPPSKIVSCFFGEEALMKAFITHLQNEVGYTASQSKNEIQEKISVEDFNCYLASFLKNDSSNKITYDKILSSRAESVKQTATADVASRDAFSSKIINLNLASVFASCGMETTVFDVHKSYKKQEIHLNVNFEKTRTRETIPAYAGVYCVMNPVLDMSNAKQIRFQAKSQDKSIFKIWVEVKPKNKSWMHESFDIELGSEYKDFCIDCQDFLYPETLECVEEITFVIKPNSFTNEEPLKGEFDIANLCIN